MNTKVKSIVALIIVIAVVGTAAPFIAIKARSKFEGDISNVTSVTVRITTAIESTTETTTQLETFTAEETTAEETHGKMTAYNEQGELTDYIGTFYVTGYTAEEGFYEGSITSSEVGCRPGICAMNDTQRRELGIEYGDSIYVEGLGTYKVQDCGCKYGRVDIWYYTDAEAYANTGYYDVYR